MLRPLVILAWWLERGVAVGIAAAGIAAGLADHAWCDAIVITQAMKSSTIAEISIEERAVRVELEIGVADLPVFANLVPDDIYQRLGNAPRPIAARHRQFFAEDLTIRPDGFPPIAGRVLNLEIRQRTLRDEITGEPLPPTANDAEQVVFATLEYPFDQRPDTLTFAPPKSTSQNVTANIGFAVFHMGLPVTDFRYLGNDELLELDWDDPWYSFFHNRNLRRQYDAPAMAFLYIEPFEVRQEIVIRPRDLQHWVDLGLDGETVLTPQRRETLKKEVGKFLLQHNPVTIDGQITAPIIDRIHFIRRTLRTTTVVDPKADIQIVSATLGIILVYPTAGLPQNVSLRWDLFSPRIQRLPAIATDEAGGMPSTLSPTDPNLHWHNFLINPTSAAMVAVPMPRTPFQLAVPVYSAIACGFLLLTVAIAWPALTGRRRWSTRWATAIALLLLTTAVLLPYGHARFDNPFLASPTVEPKQSRRVVGSLLRNVYRAFDRYEESLVYDRLAQSISGDLLADVYLQMRRSMELANQGGARVKVKTTKLIDCEPRSATADGPLSYRCTWNVSGDVGHWGHTHQRTNQYEALIEIQAIDGRWKIVDLELLAEQRLDQPTPRL